MLRLKRMVVRLGTALLTGLALSGEGTGRAFEDHFVLRVWDADEDYPFIAATSMAQTSDGYLWIGSYKGMVRFDGVRFAHDDQAINPVEGALVVSMDIDSADRLWVGTSQGIWCRERGLWRQFRSESDLPKGLVYSIACSPDGDVVALVGTKVVRWDGYAFQVLPDKENGARLFSESSCFFDRDNRLWISDSRFLSYFEEGEWHTVREPIDLQEKHRLLGGALARDGGVWFAEGTELHRFFEGRIVETKHRLIGHQFDKVSLWEDQEGNLWEAGERHGLVVHLTDGSHLTCTMDDGLPSNVLIAINRDREGNIWLGSDGGGVARIRPGRVTQTGPPKQLVWMG